MLSAVVLTLAPFVLFVGPSDAPVGKPASELNEVAELVEQLGSSDYPAREEATRRLIEVGEAAMSALQAATADSDLELARRARRILAVVGRTAALKQLEGKWKYVSIRNFGKEETGALGAELELDGDRLIMRSKDGSVVPSITHFRVDIAANPRHFDMIGPTGIAHGIYAVEGDTLTLCYPTVNGGPRPTELSTKLGDERRFHVLKRMPAEQDKSK